MMFSKNTPKPKHFYILGRQYTLQLEVKKFFEPLLKMKECVFAV